MPVTEGTVLTSAPYEISGVNERDGDLSVVEVTGEELELLLTQFPRQTRGIGENLSSWKKLAEERGDKLLFIRVRWRDDGLRRPNGLTIKGIEVKYVAFGGNLIGEDLNSPTGIQYIAKYVRLGDHDTKQWDILAY